MATTIYICNCSRGQKLKINEINRLKDILNGKEIKYTEFDDFCGTASKESQNLDLSENSVIIGCQPRAMENLLNYSGYDTAGKSISFIYIQDVLNNNNDLNLQTVDPVSDKIEYNLDWKPWFPVIDYEKCTNCKQCMDFCLFGVYEVDDDGKINVKLPHNCKDLCPACSRVCPAQAIIFPKHDSSPIDGGPGEFEVDPKFADMDKEDVYKLLLARRKRLKTHLLKKNQQKLAEEERKKCSDESKPSFEFNIIQTANTACPCAGDSTENSARNSESSIGAEFTINKIDTDQQGNEKKNNKSACGCDCDC